MTKNTATTFGKPQGQPHNDPPPQRAGQGESGNAADFQYDRVRRNWLDPREAHDTGAGITAGGVQCLMVQRWMQEGMRDQPYHNMDQVAVLSGRASAEKRNQERSEGTNV